MGNLKSPLILYLKGLLFVLLGMIAVTAIMLQFPSLYLALLLAIAIWSFCRAYYFAFYVIQHYVDPDFRFAGLLAFAQYLLTKRVANSDQPPAST